MKKAKKNTWKIEIVGCDGEAIISVDIDKGNLVDIIYALDKTKLSIIEKTLKIDEKKILN